MKRMRKYRDSLEIVADILKAAILHSSKTGIMEAANLNWNNINSYVEIALGEGFLVDSNQKYETTEKGKSYFFGEGLLSLTNN